MTTTQRRIWSIPFGGPTFFDRHVWIAGERDGKRCMTCQRGGCRIVWRHDRAEPAAPCKGQPLGSTL